ncbi:MAG: LamG domain-containing protein, partial [Gemmatimonadales bacterium]
MLNDDLVVGKIGEGTPFKGAIDFDGLDDWIDAGDINAMDGVSKLTVTAWLKPSALSQFQSPLRKGGGDTAQMRMTPGSPSTGIRAKLGNGADTYGETGSIPLSNGTWGHWAMVFDGAGATNDDRLKMYFDGVEKPMTFSGTIPATTALTADVLEIGKHEYFPGVLDELRVSSGARSAGWITTSFNTADSPAAFYTVGAESTSGGNFQMATGSYTGNGVDNRGITGAGFQPDVVIVKQYPNRNAHIRTSTMTGDTSKRFVGNLGMQANEIQSLDADGFTIGNDVFVNENGTPYHWIAFKAAGGTLKVGSYSGDLVDNRSITGIGFQPDYVIVAGELATNANVVHKSSTLAGDLSGQLRETAPAANMIQALEADGFQVGTGPEVNSFGVTYHYVAWKAAAGQVEVGSYAGSGADNRNIAVTFEPKWVLLQA